jgi:carbonic anhydrase
MDARLDVWSLLGLEVGEAHVIRNAGGLLTDDAIRSLVISQRALGTTEIVLVHHTRCGMQGLDDAEFAESLEAATGQRPAWAAGGFTDVEQDLRESMAAVRDNPFLTSTAVRGFVFDVDDGTLREIE